MWTHSLRHWTNIVPTFGERLEFAGLYHITAIKKWYVERAIPPLLGVLCQRQAWGQSTRYFGTLVLEYRFCSTRRYSVLVLLKSTCTRTCTQVLLKIKVLLTSTYGYFTSTSHRKLIQNSSQTNPKSLLQDMKHSVNDSFTIRLAIILKNDLINTLKIFQN